MPHEARRAHNRGMEHPAERRGRPGAAGADAAGAAEPAFARAGFFDPRLVLNWSEIAGPETARLSLPVRLSGGILTLKAEPGAAVFMQHGSRELCERINLYLGRPAVTRIKFVQGTLAERPHPPPRRIPAESPEADDPVQKYHGPEGLRAALVELARARRSRTIME
jgi:hypothetical protein